MEDALAHRPLPPNMRQALLDALIHLDLDELEHAFSALPFLRGGLTVLNLPHFGARHDGLVMGLLEDPHVSRNLRCLTFAPSPASMRYGDVPSFLFRSWSLPSNLDCRLWDRLTTLHLHVAWSADIVEAAMDTPMPVLETLEISIIATYGVDINYVRCFPALQHLKVLRSHPDIITEWPYPWADISMLPPTLKTLDVGWGLFSALPDGLVTARIAGLDQPLDELAFPASLTSVTITDAGNEMWDTGYARLAAYNIRFTLEGIDWHTFKVYDALDFFPSNVESLVIALDGDRDIYYPRSCGATTLVAQPTQSYLPIERNTTLIEVRSDQNVMALDSLVLQTGRQFARVKQPTGIVTRSSIAKWVKRLDGLVHVSLDYEWQMRHYLDCTITHLPSTVTRLDIVSPILLSCEMLSRLPPTVTILSADAIHGLHAIVPHLPATVQHLVIRQCTTNLCTYPGHVRTSPLTVWRNRIPRYMYDDNGGGQRVHVI